MKNLFYQLLALIFAVAVGSTVVHPISPDHDLHQNLVNLDLDSFIGPVRYRDADKTDALSGNVWSWKKYTSTSSAVTIEQPSSYELDFAKDGTINIKADCNRAIGKFTVEGANLSIVVGPTTLAICPGGSRSEQFIQLLGTASKFSVAGNMLIIVLKNESVLAFSGPSLVDRCGQKALAPRSLIDSIDPKIRGELDKKLAEFVTPAFSYAPGASMLVITPKGKYFKSAGIADAVVCSMLAADSSFQIGSNTKMMTTAIIYQLQEKKQLSTSDKISKYLPELAAKLPNGNEITIEMLLTHTSGLFDYFDVNNGDGGIAAGISNKTILTRGYRPEELVQLVVASGKSEFRPGEVGKWKYCNMGYILLGMIIEKVTKKSYEDNLKSRIFKPLMLKKTYLQVGQPAAGALPQAYYQPPFSFTTNEWNASQGWAAGAVVSTSEEFAVFLKALFTGKLFKDKKTLGLMSAYQSASKGVLGEGTIYGHGMLNNQGVLGHGGQSLGFQSDGGYLPEKDITIVIWANSASNSVNRLVVPKLAEIAIGGYKED